MFVLSLRKKLEQILTNKSTIWFLVR